jgi:glycosyltransferase involved in cell wall biosynthesis
MTGPDGADRPSAGISVVVPVLDEEAAVLATLDALDGALAGCGRASEIVVVDDGSRDRTPALLAARHGIRVLRHDASRGYGAALKTGIRSARHPWIVVIDADGTYPASAVPEDCRRIGLRPATERSKDVAAPRSDPACAEAASVTRAKIVGIVVDGEDSRVHAEGLRRDRADGPDPRRDGRAAERGARERSTSPYAARRLLRKHHELGTIEVYAGEVSVGGENRNGTIEQAPVRRIVEVHESRSLRRL